LQEKVSVPIFAEYTFFHLFCNGHKLSHWRLSEFAIEN